MLDKNINYATLSGRNEENKMKSAIIIAIGIWIVTSLVLGSLLGDGITKPNSSKWIWLRNMVLMDIVFLFPMLIILFIYHV